MLLFQRVNLFVDFVLMHLIRWTFCSTCVESSSCGGDPLDLVTIRLVGQPPSQYFY